MGIPTHITAAIRDGKMTYCGEAQLSNHGETARKGQYVEFFLDDGPDGNERHPFKGLRTGREKGQRFGLIAVPLGDNDAVEASAAQEKRKPAETRFELSRKLCGVPEFQDWMRLHDETDENSDEEWFGLSKRERYTLTSERLKFDCGITTKSSLDPAPTAHPRNHAPAIRFDQMLAEYQQATGRMAKRIGG